MQTAPTPSPSSVPPVPPAAEVVRRIESRLSRSGGLRKRLREPNLPAVRDAVARLLDVLVSAMPQVRAEVRSASEGGGPDLALRALLRSYRSFLAFRDRRPEAAALFLVDSWLDEVLGATPRPSGEGGGDDDPVLRLLEVREELADLMSRHLDDAAARGGPGREPESEEWMVLFTQAVGEAMAQRMTEGRVRAALRSIMTHLDVGQDEVGRMFRVSGETVRRWERGKTGIPSEREAAILATEAALRRLLAIFRPERLPLVVRREAELFDGETALEWILRGRIPDVVMHYENAFLYQA